MTIRRSDVRRSVFAVIAALALSVACHSGSAIEHSPYEGVWLWDEPSAATECLDINGAGFYSCEDLKLLPGAVIEVNGEGRVWGAARGQVSDKGLFDGVVDLRIKTFTVTADLDFPSPGTLRWRIHVDGWYHVVHTFHRQ